MKGKSFAIKESSLTGKTAEEEVFKLLKISKTELSCNIINLFHKLCS